MTDRYAAVALPCNTGRAALQGEGNATLSSQILRAAGGSARSQADRRPVRGGSTCAWMGPKENRAGWPQLEIEAAEIY